MQLREITDRTAWDKFVIEHAWGHPLQLWGWGEAKRGGNWAPHRLALVDGTAGGIERRVAGGQSQPADGERATEPRAEWLGAAQVLLWPIPKLGWTIAYVPRGPVVEPGSEAAARLLAELVAWAKAHGALYVRIEPGWTEGRCCGGSRRVARCAFWGRDGVRRGLGAGTALFADERHVHD
jgi:lipid II:glycine glycyltransferase (peptidoglycan interpeptide bridge formation enzyme)